MGTIAAKFEIEKGNINEIKLDNTVLGALVRESGKAIASYLDHDKKPYVFSKFL